MGVTISMTTDRKKLEMPEVQIGEDVSPKIYSDLINDNNHEHNATEKYIESHHHLHSRT